MSTQGSEFVPGDSITFKGYADGVTPEGSPDLPAGTVGEVVAVKEDQEGKIYEVQIPNPTFDANKRVSTNNPTHLKVTMFDNEVEPKSVKKSTKATAKAKAEPEAKAPAKAETAPAKKAAAPGSKTAAKAAAKPAKAAAKPATETEPAGKPAVRTKPAAKAEAETAKPSKVDTAKRTAKKLGDEPSKKALANYEPEWAPLKKEDPEIATLVEQKQGHLVEYAQELGDNAGLTDYQLGGVLYHLQLTGEFREVDPAYASKGGFALFIEQELGFSYRKAKYLIDMYYQCNKHGITGETIAELGWTKVAKIAEIVKAKELGAGEFKKLLTAAKKMSVPELEDKIRKEYKADTQGATTAFIKLGVLKLPAEAAELVQEIIAKAKKLANTEDFSTAVEYIINDWAVNMGGADDVGLDDETDTGGEQETEAPRRRA